MISPPVWSPAQLQSASDTATEHFREGRHTEPLELYLKLFDEYQGIVEEFMEQTVDLTELDAEATNVLSDLRKQEVLRYVTGPPISVDDLKVLVQTKSLSRKQITGNPQLVTRIVTFVRDWHDRRRFPWLGEGWEPDENARQAAIIATSALLAMRRLETMRRNEGKQIQELLVDDALTQAGLEKVATRTVSTLSKAPRPGQFCRESKLGTRKADFIIGLWDGRTMAIECKVSNSTINSIKRVNNDAAAKAEAWIRDFGQRQVVPCAVLAGVFKSANLEQAQSQGLTLFWAHDLQQMVDWILRTRSL